METDYSPYFNLPASCIRLCTLFLLEQFYKKQEADLIFHGSYKKSVYIYFPFNNIKTHL